MNDLKCPFPYNENQKNKNLKLMTTAIYNDRHRYLGGYDIHNNKSNECICKTEDQCHKVIDVIIKHGTGDVEVKTT